MELDLLTLRVTDAVNRACQKDFRWRFRKLLRYRSDRKRSKIITHSRDYQRGLAVALRILQREKSKLEKELAQP